MFAISKLFWMIANPVNLIIFFLIIGTVLLFTRFRRLGQVLVASTVAVILLASVLPVGGWMAEQLENRFPANPELPSNVAGIILLGGTINQHLTDSRGQPALSAGGGRFTEFVFLARRFPHARLIFSGGSGSLINQDLKEADAAQVYFSRIGMTERRILYERESRNTFENAVFSRRLVPDLMDRKWVLVTSALHMPRAVGVFRKAGWDLLPYPADYSTDGRRSFKPSFNPLGGLASLSKAAREWIGLIAYRILGRTEVLYPSPRQSPDI